MDWTDLTRLCRFLSLYVVVPLGLGFLAAVLEKFRRDVTRITDVLGTLCMPVSYTHLTLPTN